MSVGEQRRSQSRMPPSGTDRGVDVAHFVAILRRRPFFLILPFVAVFITGFIVTMVLKPIYVAEGKILVESQQIPTDLVRPTITATAKERIQVIEQRIMTRENLLAIVEKFKMFADRRNSLSGTQLLDLMRQRARVVPFELDPARRRSDNVTIALTISFEDENPEMAMRVANELVTLILAEDARNRTSRAQETTNFLSREVKKLENDLATIDVSIAEYRARNNREPVSEKASVQLSLLKAELQDKAAIYSDAHPDMIRLKKQIAALEKISASTTQVESGLEALLSQRATLQKNLDGTTQKLAAARVGENLERAQFSERLEILEQAVLPQKPVKPNRPKLLAFAFAAAMLFGIGAVFGAEMTDNTIRGPRDIASILDAHLLTAVPYITTRKEVQRRKANLLLTLCTMTTATMIAALAIHIAVRPLDELWTAFVARLIG